MKIKIGIAPIAWSNDDMPELGGSTPIETCLYEAKKVGFSGIELGGKFPRNPRITNYLLKKFKLKMPGGWYGSLLRKRSINEEWAAMQDQLNLLKIVKGDIFVFADVSGSIQSDGSRPLSSRPTLEKEEWNNYCEKISEISNRLFNEGIPMSYHEHMGTIIQNEEDIDKFMNKTNDKTFLLYDTGHLLFAQADYEKILRTYIDRINHVHCKDIRKNILNKSLNQDMSFRESFTEGIFTVPGDGYIDFEPLFKILFNNKYLNWIIVEAEQNPIKANPFKYAKIGYDYLSKTLEKVGFEI